MISDLLLIVGDRSRVLYSSHMSNSIDLVIVWCDRGSSAWGRRCRTFHVNILAGREEPNCSARRETVYFSPVQTEEHSPQVLSNSLSVYIVQLNTVPHLVSVGIYLRPLRTSKVKRQLFDPRSQSIFMFTESTVSITKSVIRVFRTT